MQGERERGREGERKRGREEERKRGREEKKKRVPGTAATIAYGDTIAYEKTGPLFSGPIIHAIPVRIIPGDRTVR